MKYGAHDIGGAEAVGDEGLLAETLPRHQLLKFRKFRYQIELGLKFSRLLLLG